MWKRHVYATSGVRIYLDFKLNGVFMGDEITVSDSESSKVMEVEVHGTAPIDRIDIIRSNEVLRSYHPSQWDFEETFVDDGYSSGEDFYMVRVVQKDGNRAWTSPIWVDLGVEGRVNFAGQEATWLS
jgi:hypothetical protein